MSFLRKTSHLAVAIAVAGATAASAATAIIAAVVVAAAAALHAAVWPISRSALLHTASGSVVQSTNTLRRPR